MESNQNQNNPASEVTPPVAPSQLKEKHPLVIRWTHWVNFPLMVILTWSGLLLYWENSNFRIGIGSFTLMKLFPAAFYEALHLTNRNSEGLAWHLPFMWLFAANWMLYLTYLGVSGEWRYITPSRSALSHTLAVVLHDLHLRKAKPPEGKYNAAQKIAYSAVALMGVLMIVTGFALWRPEQLGWLAAPFGGEDNAKAVHFWLTILFFVYFVVHVAQVVRAGWNNFRSMIVGYELVASGGAEMSEPTEPPLKRLQLKPDMTAEERIRTFSRRGFKFAAIAALVVIGAWIWAVNQSGKDGVPSFLRWATESKSEERDRESKSGEERNQEPSSKQEPTGQGSESK